MDTGLLILRSTVGGLLVGHGAQKLWGWFGGYGLDGTGGWMESIGFRPGRAMAALAGTSEVTSGSLLALGLASPLGPAVASGTMLVAASHHRPNGLWAVQDGYEFPLALSLASAALAFTGPGRYSIDGLLHSRRNGNRWGVAAVALAVATAAGLRSWVGRQAAEAPSGPPVDAPSAAEEAGADEAGAEEAGVEEAGAEEAGVAASDG